MEEEVYSIQNVTNIFLFIYVTIYLFQMEEADNHHHSHKSHQTKQDSLLWNQKKTWSKHNPKTQNINIFALCRGALGGKKEAEESGTKEWSWAWEERRWDEGVFDFVFASVHRTLFLIGNKQNSFFPSWVCFPCDPKW